MYKYLLLAIAVLGLPFLAGCSPWKYATAGKLANAATAYSTEPTNPQHRVLVVGDSTAVGTGASTAKKSMVGLIGQNHPDWLITNLAVNGAKFSDVVKQLQSDEKRYDLVLIMAGGNDVMRGTSENALKKDLETAITLAQKKAPHVTVMPCGDVGLAPFFWPPLSWWMSYRSKTMHQLVSSTADTFKVQYISLLQPDKSNPFILQADALHAADSLHPSDAGYAHWYGAIVTQNGLAPLIEDTTAPHNP